MVLVVALGLPMAELSVRQVLLLFVITLQPRVERYTSL